MKKNITKSKKKKTEFIRNSHYSLSKLDKRAWPWWQARSSGSKLSRNRVKYLELMDGHFVGIQTDRGKKVTGDDSPRSVDGDLWSKLKLWFGFLRLMAIVDSNCEEILEREMRNWRFYSGRPLSFSPSTCEENLFANEITNWIKRPSRKRKKKTLPSRCSFTKALLFSCSFFLLFFLAKLHI